MASLSYFAERMRYWCDEGNLGYDQTQRWNIWEGGESDCSSLVIHALDEAGFDTGSATYTGDLSWNLTQRGWERLSPDISSARVGDILLSDANHVAAVVYGWGWWATIAEAWLDENGGIYYGQSGDQTGLETRTRSIYDFPWDCILRYTGESEDDMEPVDVWAYKNESVNGNDDAYKLLTDIRNAVTGNGISSWGYKNHDVNGDNDAYKLLTDAYHQLTRADTAGHDNPQGHDIFGRVQIIEKDVREIKEAISNIKVEGASVDYDKLANKVADVIYARMKQ